MNKLFQNICVLGLGFLPPALIDAQTALQTLQIQQQADSAMLQRRLGALQANQRVLTQLIFNLQNQTPSTFVPGETSAQRQARHQAIFEELQHEAQVQYEREHPFSPSGNGWKPSVDQKDYDDAIKESDGQLAQEARDRQEAQRQRELQQERRQMLELQRQIMEIQQQLLQLQREKEAAACPAAPPAQNRPSTSLSLPGTKS